jgi:hypothetical protein
LEEVVENQVFVGIDVFKVRLDAAVRPGDESFSLTNSQRGIATLVKRLKKLCVSRIVLYPAIPSRNCRRNRSNSGRCHTPIPTY